MLIIGADFDPPFAVWAGLEPALYVPFVGTTIQPKQRCNYFDVNTDARMLE